MNSTEKSMESRMRQCWDKVRDQMDGFEPHDETKWLTDGKAYIEFFELFERDLKLPLGLASHMYLNWYLRAKDGGADLFEYMAQQLGMRLGLQRYARETKVYIE